MCADVDDVLGMVQASTQLLGAEVGSLQYFVPEKRRICGGCSCGRRRRGGID